MKTELDHIDKFFIRLAQARSESEPLKWSAKDQAALQEAQERIERKLDQQKAV